MIGKFCEVAGNLFWLTAVMAIPAFWGGSFMAATEGFLSCVGLVAMVVSVIAWAVMSVVVCQDAFDA